MERYTPKILEDNTVEILIQGEKCASCSCIMIQKETHALFPRSWQNPNRLEHQMKRANMFFISNSRIDDKKICLKCEEEGKGSFECFSCEKSQSTKKLHKSYGEPADYLCTDCYENIPAKEWDELEDRLRELHRYDFN